MNQCQTKLYENILERLAARGAYLAEALAKHAPPNKRGWLLEHAGEKPRNPEQIPYASRLTPTEILISFVEKIGVEDNSLSCWPFSGYCNPYGQTYVLRGIVRSHVLMKSLWDGLPENYGGKRGTYVAVRHSCDNPKCCNPTHLLGGTVQDNINDIFDHGKREHGWWYGKTTRCPWCGSVVRRTRYDLTFCNRTCYDKFRDMNRASRGVPSRSADTETRKLWKSERLKEGRAVALDFILPHLHRADPNLPEDQQV